MVERLCHPDLFRMLDLEESFAIEGSPDEIREAWRDFCVALNPARPRGIVVQDLTVPMDGFDLPIRIYRSDRSGVDGPAPEADVEGGRSTGLLPVVVYIHGGGWVVNDLDTNDAIGWGLAQGTGAGVVSIHYRLAPEHPYPAAFDDCYRIVEWIVDNGRALELDPDRMVVCGDSAGGNLTAAICLAARDRRGPRILAQGLIFPVLDIDIDRPSYHDNALGYGLTREAMVYFLDAYLPDREAADAYAMPLRAPDLTNLPPALVHTAEFDPLRDEGKAYADRLAAAGNDVTYRMGEGMTHSFIRARFDGHAPAAEFQFIVDYLKEALR